MEEYPIAQNQYENSSQHLLTPVYYYTKQPNCTMKSKTAANTSSQMLGKCNNLIITLIKIVLLPHIINIPKHPKNCHLFILPTQAYKTMFSMKHAY